MWINNKTKHFSILLKKLGKSVDSFHEQLKLIYEEAIWCNNSIIVLDNLDFILENANLDNDPKLKLYCYQLIEGGWKL